jgi:thiosulfate/3-mercaptopyruvate sulfurtransferase
VTTRWLAEQLGRPELVILDTSWYLPTSGRDPREEYQAGHLPGAVFFDLDRASDPTSPWPHMLPSGTEFARYIGELGVGPDSLVVVYDGSGANLSAARVWWMLRVFGHEEVAVLDGGIGKWRAEGRPLTRGTETRPPATFTGRFDPARVRDLSAVRAALSDGSAQVVDLRSAARFAGTEPEPRPGLPSGHMPGAFNLPFTDLVHPDGTALTNDEVGERLRLAGIALDRPVIATCGSGTSACNLLLALHRLGQADAVLYDGSWTEWAGSGMPVVRGREA